MVDIDFGATPELNARICVIGVGGAGCNAVASMIKSGVEGVDFIVANTDAQALNASPATKRIQLGRRSTQGLGAGASAEVGRIAAEESMDDILLALEGAHMCFVAAGMGGGTGTGAAPVIAAAARARGILTVGVVTKPFMFEGRRRADAAERGIEALNAHVDTLIVIPNQNLFRIASPSTTFKQAFEMADDILDQGVRSITNLMVMPGLINLDFADVRSIMSWMGKAMLGCGEATGEDRAVLAAEQAISNPLLDGAIDGAKGLIISIAGGDDLKLMEVDEAANHIKDLVDPEADIVWGSTFDNSLQGKIRVSVVATGIEPKAACPDAAALLARKLEEQTAKSRKPETPFMLADKPQAAPVEIRPEPAPEPAPVAPVPVATAARAALPPLALEVGEPLPETQLALGLEPETLVPVIDLLDAELAPKAPSPVAPMPLRAPVRASVSINREDVAPRGPSLFGRIASLAAGSRRKPQGTESVEPGVYRRRGGFVPAHA